MDNTKEKIIQNLKVVKIMKSCGYKDGEIAGYLGVSVMELLNTITGDTYLKEVWDNAQEKLASDIERKFLENVMKQMETGDNTDAKWLLERTNKKYQKKDALDVTLTTVDEIIRNNVV